MSTLLERRAVSRYQIDFKVVSGGGYHETDCIRIAGWSCCCDRFCLRRFGRRLSSEGIATGSGVAELDRFLPWGPCRRGLAIDTQLDIYRSKPTPGDNPRFERRCTARCGRRHPGRLQLAICSGLGGRDRGRYILGVAFRSPHEQPIGDCEYPRHRQLGFDERQYAVAIERSWKARLRGVEYVVVPDRRRSVGQRGILRDLIRRTRRHPQQRHLVQHH